MLTGPPPKFHGTRDILRGEMVMELSWTTALMGQNRRGKCRQ